MRKLRKFVLHAKWAALTALGLLSIAALPTRAGAVETSATVSARHAECGADIWRHLERRARARADTFCAARGGVDDETLHWVHHDSAYGADELCVVHLHYGCLAELPGDAEV